VLVPFQLVIAALTLVAVGCATPVGVQRVDAQTVHRTLTTNVISSGEPSPFSSQVLHRLGLFEGFQKEPEKTLARLHAQIPEQGGQDLVIALAELSFLHAEKSGKRSYDLAAAVYAYAFLFPEDGTQPEPFDPRLRLAADLYNRGITEGLSAADGPEVVLGPGTFELSFGVLEIAMDPSGFRWGDSRLVRFMPVADLEVPGLRNRYRRPGIGAPLAASIETTHPRTTSEPTLRIPKDLKVPVTAFVRIADPRRGLADGRLQGTLELYAEDIAPALDVAGRQVPLEYEPTSSLAYGLAESPIWDFEIKGFLSGEYRESRDGLYMLHPYHPGRIPVVLVHGTASSPGRWAELLNELWNDPTLQERYQFWFFLYNTGNPILYSAGVLRGAVRDAVAELDPEGKDPALRRIVMIGHSQGGLLTKLMVAAKLSISDETRELLRTSMFFEPVPEVKRVVFIATPHRGSFLAGRRLGQLASGLVKLPGTLAQSGRDLVERNPDKLARRSLDRLPSSVDNMDPSHHFIRTLAEIPIAEGRISHSIIPVKGEGPPAKLNDGVVEYASAHLAGAASELVVRSGHSTQSRPETIEEVRRILHQHLEGP
jgi:pimeloyl-ACP methyl ester carboxylesterase